MDTTTSDGQAYVTLSISGTDEQVAIAADATAAVLFDAVGGALDASTVKLVHKGRRLTRDDALAPGMRVLCLGTSTRDKEAVAAKKSDPTIRSFKQEAAREAARNRTDGFVQHPEYKFCRIEAVKRFDGRSGPHRFEAEKLLQSLAAEVAPIMASHEWTVGGLLEMDPRDDQLLKQKQQEGGCLLGYNENGGARIYVKLRTDADGFRGRDELLKTLLHELCHNVVGPHNAAFFALYAEVRSEHLSTRKDPGPPCTVADLRDPSKASARDLVAGEIAAEAGNGALRGGERMSAAVVARAVAALPDAPAAPRPPAPAVDVAASRAAAAAAADQRRVGAFADCGCGVCGTCAVPAAAPADMELDTTPPASDMEVAPTPAPGAAPASAMEVEPTPAASAPEPATPEPPTSAFEPQTPPPPDPGLASLAAMGFEGPNATAALAATGGDVSAALERLLNGITTPAVAPETGSRQERVLRASSDLHALGDPAREAAATLTAIFSNAEKPGGKFKRVRLGNKKFLRTAGKFAAALRLLEAVGFERESSVEGDVYALRRTDPGLLWLGRSAIADLISP